MENKKKDELLEAADVAINGVVDFVKKLGKNLNPEIKIKKEDIKEEFKDIKNEIKSTIESLINIGLHAGWDFINSLDGNLEEKNQKQKKSKIPDYYIKIEKDVYLGYFKSISINEMTGNININLTPLIGEAQRFLNISDAQKIYPLIEGRYGKLTNYKCNITICCI